MQITLDIKDNKFKTFLSFIKMLDFVDIKEDKDSIPQWTQDIVMNRVNDKEGFVDEDTFFKDLDKELK